MTYPTDPQDRSNRESPRRRTPIVYVPRAGTRAARPVETTLDVQIRRRRAATDRHVELLNAIAAGDTRGLPPGERITLEVSVLTDHAPALRSLVMEISDELAERACGSYEHAHEAAVTRALIAVAALRASVCAAIASEDSDYYGRDR